MKVSAILVAAGSSVRMGGIDKLRLMIGGQSVLERSFTALVSNSLIGEIVVVVREEKVLETERLIERKSPDKPVIVVAGGETRFLSVQNGIAAASPGVEYFCIHDAARPFVSDNLIERTINAAVSYGAAAGGLPVSDTLKRVSEDGFSEETLVRCSLRAMGTPQVFESALYRKAAEAFDNIDALDDCEVVERYGGQVAIIDGDPQNIKITTQRDVPSFTAGPSMRVGYGYDVHRFAENREFILGGVVIPFAKGLLGHSDADVLTHAVIDAVLGAAALGDIGEHFPNSDPAFKDADSLTLLRQTTEKSKNAGFSVVNIDATIVCEKPVLSAYKSAMRKNIAQAAGIDCDRVSVKATTEEGLGFTGKGTGVAACACVMLQSK